MFIAGLAVRDEMKSAWSTKGVFEAYIVSHKPFTLFHYILKQFVSISQSLRHSISLVKEGLETIIFGADYYWPIKILYGICCDVWSEIWVQPTWRVNTCSSEVFWIITLV